jgi:hypothetical protein
MIRDRNGCLAQQLQCEDLVWHVFEVSLAISFGLFGFKTVSVVVGFEQGSISVIAVFFDFAL